MKDRIVFEDDHLIVLNKPAGISVTPGPGNPFEATIAGWVLEYIGESLKQVGLENRWGIVHRLDKDTSGVLLTAKTSTMFDHLAGQFRTQTTKKEYSTLVWGDVLKKVKRKAQSASDSEITTFVVDAPIGRHPKGISRFIVTPEGKPSRTDFHIEKIYSIADREGELPLTLITAFPKSGRTHQIRVHLKAFDHPVVGDKTYQSRTQFAISQRFIQRQFLHARTIEFADLEGNMRRFEAPLADDLVAAMDELTMSKALDSESSSE